MLNDLNERLESFEFKSSTLSVDTWERRTMIVKNINYLANQNIYTSEEDEILCRLGLWANACQIPKATSISKVKVSSWEGPKRNDVVRSALRKALKLDLTDIPVKIMCGYHDDKPDNSSDEEDEGFAKYLRPAPLSEDCGDGSSSDLASHSNYSTSGNSAPVRTCDGTNNETSLDNETDGDVCKASMISGPEKERQCSHTNQNVKIPFLRNVFNRKSKEYKNVTVKEISEDEKTEETMENIIERKKNERDGTRYLTTDIMLSHEMKSHPSNFDVRTVSKGVCEKQKKLKKKSIARSASLNSMYDVWKKYQSNRDINTDKGSNCVIGSECLNHRYKEDQGLRIKQLCSRLLSKQIAVSDLSTKDMEHRCKMYNTNTTKQSDVTFVSKCDKESKCSEAKKSLCKHVPTYLSNSSFDSSTLVELNSKGTDGGSVRDRFLPRTRRSWSGIQNMFRQKKETIIYV